MAADNQSVLDYYLLPQLDLGPARLRLADDNGLGLDCFRFARSTPAPHDAPGFRA